MKAQVLASTIERLIAQHHQAFAVELLGTTGAGVSAAQIQDMLAAGLIDPSRLGGVIIPGMRHRCDPFLFLQMVAEVMAGANPAELAHLADRSIGEWTADVDAAIAARVGAYVDRGGTGAVTVAEDVAVPRMPEASERPVPRAEVEAPPWLSPAERGAYSQAVGRAGEYARGLGNLVSADTLEAVGEAWEGEEILAEVQPDKRAEKLAIIREEVGRAVAENLDVDELARNMAERSGDWAHNWERIAKTELQGALNEGIAIEAAQVYGEAARVARIPEGGACRACRALLLDDRGLPRIWSVRELVDNGTNVGRRPQDWRATLWPIHPNCLCQTIIVPPGMAVTADGRLERAEAR